MMKLPFQEEVLREHGFPNESRFSPPPFTRPTRQSRCCLSTREGHSRYPTPHSVHVRKALCEGSIDGQLEGNIHVKADSAELVLDGQLLGEQASEGNLYELLRMAQAEFNRSQVTMLDEGNLEAECCQTTSPQMEGT